MQLSPHKKTASSKAYYWLEPVPRFEAPQLGMHVCPSICLSQFGRQTIHVYKLATCRAIRLSSRQLSQNILEPSLFSCSTTGVHRLRRDSQQTFAAAHPAFSSCVVVMDVRSSRMTVVREAGAKVAMKLKKNAIHASCTGGGECTRMHALKSSHTGVNLAPPNLA